MTIDFSRPLKDIITGDSLKEEGKEVTLGLVAVGALMAPDDKASDTEKANRYKIAFMILKATGPVELSLEDAATMKRLIGKHPLPLVVGQAYELLEGGGGSERATPRKGKA